MRSDGAGAGRWALWSLVGLLALIPGLLWLRGLQWLAERKPPAPEYGPGEAGSPGDAPLRPRPPVGPVRTLLVRVYDAGGLPVSHAMVTVELRRESGWVPGSLVAWTSVDGKCPQVIHREAAEARVRVEPPGAEPMERTVPLGEVWPVIVDFGSEKLEGK